MEQTYQLKKPSSIKRRKRVGCGPSSGSGKTCGRGMNGQMCRSGSKKRAWFEGGQMPLQRRVPKRGFNNIHKKEYQLINLSDIERCSIKDANPEVLLEKGLIKDINKLIKVLGKGEITSSVKIVADSFSSSAAEKIKKAGGEAIIRDLSIKNEE